MKSFPLAQSAAINCRQRSCSSQSMERYGMAFSMARNEIGGARSSYAICQHLMRIHVHQDQDRQKQHVLPAGDIDTICRHRIAIAFPSAKGKPFCECAAFTFCFIKFSPLRFVPAGWQFEYFTHHVRVYCIFLLLLFLLLWLLPLHIYAFVCPKNGAQKTHQRNCNSRNGTEPCTICICMHFAWQFQLQRHWQWHGSQKMAKDSGSGAGATKCASFAWKIAFLCAPHFTLADLRFLHFSLTFFPCLSCFPLPAFPAARIPYATQQ